MEHTCNVELHIASGTSSARVLLDGYLYVGNVQLSHVFKQLVTDAIS